MRDNPVAAPGSGGGSPPERLLVVCDFDGTVCRVDMGNAFLERFAEGWEEIDRSYAAGEVGSRAAYSRIALCCERLAQRAKGSLPLPAR